MPKSPALPARSHRVRRTLLALGVLALAAGLPASMDRVAPVTAEVGDGTLSVRVIRDFDGDGRWDAFLPNDATAGGSTSEPNEPGVAGMVVEVFDAAGHVRTATTDATGTATFPPDGTLQGGRYRVEASIPAELDYLHPARVEPGATGADALASLVSFVDVGAGRDASVLTGVWNPSDWSPEDPRFATSLMWGNYLDQSARQSVLSWLYREGPHDGPANEVQLDVGSGDRLAQLGEVGSTWGLAGYDEERAFVAASNRWAVDVGPAGRGAIYFLDLGDPDGVAVGSKQVFATVADVGLSCQTPDASAGSLVQPVGDCTRATFFDNIGKQGLGDIDLSEDHRTLYAVNLNTRSLVSIPVIEDPATGAVAAGAATSTPISMPAGACADPSDFRPWGLGVKDGSVFVGAVCTGQSTGSAGDLRAIIFRSDADALAFGTAQVIVDQPIAGPRDNMELALAGQTNADWQPWDDVPRMGQVSGAMPLVSDIHVASNGDLIVGMINRMGMQYGQTASTATGGTASHTGGGGDVVRVCRTAGGYAWEREAGCPVGPKQLASTLGNNAPERYSGDYFAGATHFEHALGGISYLKGKQFAVTTAFDPSNVLFTQGVKYLDEATGWKPSCSGGGFALRAGTLDDDCGGLYFQEGSANPAFGKGNGMGDISALIGDAPLQIGNYLWFDRDHDGVMDPGELPVPGATVHLYAADAQGRPAGAPIATTDTAPDGSYYFGTEDGLEPETRYVVAVDDPADFQAGGVLESWRPTVTGTGTAGAAGADANDSDGVPSGDPARQIPGVPIGFPEALVSTGLPGQNDHTYDFGFSQAPSIDVEKGDTGSERPGGLVNDADTPGGAVGFEPGEARAVAFTVTNDGSEPLVGVTVTDATVSGGAVQDLACRFPGTSADTVGVLSGGVWTVRWAESFGSSPARFAVGASFGCTATLQLDGSAAPHADSVSVSGTGAVSGLPVDDRDDYHAFTGEVQIIKFDGRGDYVAAVGGDGIPEKPLSSEPERDANVRGDAVTYLVPSGSTSTGAQPVELVVTNTGSTWLTDVKIADATLEGPAMTGLSCTFPDGSTGTTWVGPWEPGVSFPCTGSVDLSTADPVHGDEVRVDATVVKPKPNPDWVPGDPDSNPFTDEPAVGPDGTPERSDIDVTDDDPYWADATTLLVDKQLVGEPVVHDDRSVDLTYAIDVVSSGPGSTTYDLDDQLRFGGDIEVRSATVANEQPGSIDTDPAWDGIDDVRVVTGQRIGAGATHRYLVHVRAVVATTTTVTEADCVLAEDETGTGFLNEAVLTYEDHEERDIACPEPKPVLSVEKAVVGAPTLNPDGTWDVAYDLVVRNTGPVPGTYRLDDRIRFGGAIDLIDADARNTDPGTIVVRPSWDGIEDVVVIEDQPIGVGATHRYRVVATAAAPPDLRPAATDCQVVPGEQGTGFLNTATLRWEREERTDDGCAPVPAVGISKVLRGAPKVGADGAVVAEYELRVVNTGEGATTYTLDDQLRWGAGLDVTGAEVTSAPDGQQADPAWDGRTHTTIATDVELPAASQHVWVVRVHGHLQVGVHTSQTGDCRLEKTEHGTGLLNQARLTVDRRSVGATACAPVEPRRVTPPAPAPPAAVAHTQLPYTGADSAQLAGIGMVLMASGWFVLAAARRRREAER